MFNITTISRYYFMYKKGTLFSDCARGPSGILHDGDTKTIFITSPFVTRETLSRFQPPVAKKMSYIPTRSMLWRGA